MTIICVWSENLFNEYWKNEENYFNLLEEIKIIIMVFWGVVDAILTKLMYKKVIGAYNRILWDSKFLPVWESQLRSLRSKILISLIRFWGLEVLILGFGVFDFSTFGVWGIWVLGFWKFGAFIRSLLTILSIFLMVFGYFEGVIGDTSLGYLELFVRLDKRYLGVWGIMYWCLGD